MFDFKTKQGTNRPATKAFEILFYGACSRKVIPPAGRAFRAGVYTGRGNQSGDLLNLCRYLEFDEQKRRSARTATALHIAGVGVLLLAAAGGLYWLYRRTPTELPSEDIHDDEVTLPPPPEHELHQIVMMRYDDEAIDHLFELIPETNRLTGRELEVLREILHGKKQGEVAYYLGIEVSTVKDFYRKIYDKLGVPNKDGLFRMVSERLLQADSAGHHFSEE